MVDRTLRSLAEEMRIEPDDLLGRLSRLGIRRSVDDPLSEGERGRLLACLGIQTPAGQLVLHRRTYGVLNFSGVGGREKTVEVEVRRRCVYNPPRSPGIGSPDGEADPAPPRPEQTGRTAGGVAPVEQGSRGVAIVPADEPERHPAGSDLPTLPAGGGGRRSGTVSCGRPGIGRRAREIESVRSRPEMCRRAAGPGRGIGKGSSRDDGGSGFGAPGVGSHSATAPLAGRFGSEGGGSPRTEDEKIIRAGVVVEEVNPLEMLAGRMSVDCSSIVEHLLRLGLKVPDDRLLDRQSARLIVEGMGRKVISRPEDERERLIVSRRSAWDVRPRPPVVVVVGHVDHGKTSLLDRIRSSGVVGTEVGGITQRIGASRVETPRGSITFLDTPGHAAFAAVRTRGLRFTDIVLLVVAVDDGVMPQTVEAVRQAQSAHLPLVVAVSKIDKGRANLDRIRRELSRHGVVPEEWRGENQFVCVSAKLGTGITDLLEAILLQAELLELRAPAQGMASGVVVESSLDRGRGPVGTVLISEGRLRRGEVVLCGTEFGRVRSLHDERGTFLEEAGPSSPVEISGLSGVPVVGDRLLVLGSEKEAREIALLRRDRAREDRFSRQRLIREGLPVAPDLSQRSLNLVLKVDRWGSAEAIEFVLRDLPPARKVVPRIVSVGIGSVNESDSTLAADHGAVILGFNVRVDSAARRVAELEGLRLHCYSVIYDLVRGVEQLVAECEAPVESGLGQVPEGLAEVRSVFSVPEFGVVAGCVVVRGVVRRSRRLRVLRDGRVCHEGTLDSLRRFREDVDEVSRGAECGIGIRGFGGIRPGDVIETSADGGR